jgi:hypothetical protein
MEQIEKDDSVQHRGVLFTFLKLAYLLQINLPEKQTEELGKDLFMIDFTQSKWHDKPEVESVKDFYIS